MAKSVELHKHTPIEIMGALRRTLSSIQVMQNDPSCPKREIQDEIHFAEHLQDSLNNLLANGTDRYPPMHNIVFKNGFWPMLIAFIAAQQHVFVEIAMQRSIDVQHVKVAFFEQLLAVCNTLQNTPVPNCFRQMLLPRQRNPTISQHLSVVVFEREIAFIRWRNQSGVIVVNEVVSPADLELHATNIVRPAQSIHCDSPLYTFQNV